MANWGGFALGQSENRLGKFFPFTVAEARDAFPVGYDSLVGACTRRPPNAKIRMIDRV